MSERKRDLKWVRLAVLAPFLIFISVSCTSCARRYILEMQCQPVPATESAPLEDIPFIFPSETPLEIEKRPI